MMLRQDNGLSFREFSHNVRSELRRAAASSTPTGQQVREMRRLGEGIALASYGRATGVQLHGGAPRLVELRSRTRNRRVLFDAVNTLAGRALGEFLDRQQQPGRVSEVAKVIHAGSAVLEVSPIEEKAALYMMPLYYAVVRLVVNLYAGAEGPEVVIGDFDLGDKVPFGALASGERVVVSRPDDNPLQHLMMLLHELAHTTGAVFRLNRESVLAGLKRVGLNGTLYEETVAQLAALALSGLLIDEVGNVEKGRSWLFDQTPFGAAGMVVLRDNIGALMAHVTAVARQAGLSEEAARTVVMRVVGEQVLRDATDAVDWMLGNVPVRDVEREHREFVEYLVRVLGEVSDE